LIPVDQIAFTVRWPGKVVFGPGQLANLGQEAKLLGQHAFLATTAELAALGLTDRVQWLLESSGVSVTRFEAVQPDPTCLAVGEGAA
jgi:alcohol dehydrogenase class IV